MTGRPSIFSDSLADTICERIAEGEGLRAICRDEGMPGRRTVLDWLNDDTKADFRAKYSRAREAQGDFLDEEMQAEASSATPENVQVAKLRIETMKWRASKLAPKRYGDKIAAEVTGKDGAPLANEPTTRELAMAVLELVRQGSSEPEQG